MKQIYRSFCHTSDIGFYIYGDTLRNLFANAAACYYRLLTEYKPSGFDKKLGIRASGLMLEDFWVRWFNELIFQFQVNSMMLFKIESFKIKKNEALITACFQKVTGLKPKIEVKAATYHKASVKIHNNGFRGTIILDV